MTCNWQHVATYPKPDGKTATRIESCPEHEGGQLAYMSGYAVLNLAVWQSVPYHQRAVEVPFTWPVLESPEDCRECIRLNAFNPRNTKRGRNLRAVKNKWASPHWQKQWDRDAKLLAEHRKQHA